MKTRKQNNKTETENQELREWKKPELKVLDKERTEGYTDPDVSEDAFGSVN
ncbi:MAG: hypothetical protein R6U04_00205 [Bacteroidales bacterium]